MEIYIARSIKNVDLTNILYEHLHNMDLHARSFIDEFPHGNLRECEEYDEEHEIDFDLVIYVDAYVDEDVFKRGVYYEIKTQFVFPDWDGERVYGWWQNYDILLKFIHIISK